MKRTNTIEKLSNKLKKNCPNSRDETKIEFLHLSTVCKTEEFNLGETFAAFHDSSSVSFFFIVSLTVNEIFRNIITLGQRCEFRSLNQFRRGQIVF